MGLLWQGVKQRDADGFDSFPLRMENYWTWGFWENSLTRSNNEDRHEAVRGSVHRPVPLFLSGVEPIELSIDPLGDFTREDANQQLVDHWP